MAWSHLVRQGRHFSNSARYALPQFCSCPILYRCRTSSRPGCTHLHYRSFTFLIQTLFLPATTKTKKDFPRKWKIVLGRRQSRWIPTAHGHHLLWHIPNHCLEATPAKTNYPKLHSPAWPRPIHPREATAWMLHLSLPDTSLHQFKTSL